MPSDKTMEKSKNFQGFSPETGAFLWELSFHNERPWFLSHKEEFERVLHRPFQALAADCLRGMDARYPELGFQVHLSRIYRDARRLFGRGPYKDHMWLILHVGSRHAQGPAFWFELGPATYNYGLGFWDASSAVMDELRRRIDANPAAFERLVGELAPGWKLWGEPYKRPKGERGPVIDPWYNRRFLSVGWEKDLGGEAFEARLPELLCERFAALMELHALFVSAWTAGSAAASANSRTEREIERT